MQPGTPEFAALKAGMKAVWSAGDFGQLASRMTRTGEEFIERLGIKAGDQVLDVACGTGNTALPAARAGADVIGVDIAPNLLEQARQRAAEEKLNARFQEGDAEELAFEDKRFDFVVTMFGAMFAPRPERVASELIRVTRPGGVIAMGNWLTSGFVAKTFQVTAQWAPPPPGLPSPLLWGDEAVVRQRLASGVSNMNFEVRKIEFKFPFGPREVVGFFREYFGPTKMAFARLDPEGQKGLTSALEAVWSDNNQATDGTTKIEVEYLEVRAVRA